GVRCYCAARHRGPHRSGPPRAERFEPTRRCPCVAGRSEDERVRRPRRRAWGHRRRPADDPRSRYHERRGPTARHRAHGLSEPVATTAMMRLVDQGKVDLHAPVRTYLPEFKVRDDSVSRDVTVWHLLTHLGGWEGQVTGPDRGTDTLRNFVATTLPDLMQVAPPGKAWSYNNAGFSIAGRVIEVATGKSINQAMRDLVFQPLGLEHAGTTAGEFIVQRFAAGHFTRDGKTTLQRPFSPSTSVTA